MYRGPVKAAGNDLHRLGVLSVGPDGFQPTIMGQEHPMPAVQCLMGQRLCKIGIDVDHHFRDALFARFGRVAVRIEAQMAAQRRLDTEPIEDFTLDGARLHRFLAEKFDAELLALRLADMMDRAEDFSGRQQERLLKRLQRGGVIPEIRPIGQRPVPSHEL